ncbi:MAG: M30 family zinc metallopeptidase [Oscillospiraceae bacterium]
MDKSTNPTVVVSDENAKKIGEEFDKTIYSLVTDNFYHESDVNSDSKIAILCYDIQDGFTGSGGYIGGYFYGGDLFNNSDENKSNEMELFYIDTYPAMGIDKNNPDVAKAYSTLAHEFQHMVNFNKHRIETSIGNMDTWLNEALSMAAEHMYEGVQTNRISYYNRSEAVENGRSLLNWDDNNEVLANYSLSYLFSQYLRTQLEEAQPSKNVKYFKEIIEDNERGYKAVENVIHKYIDKDMSFEEFMTNFRTAMLIKSNTGRFGFNGEEDFNTISTPLYLGGKKDLNGGGAIVKSISSSFTDPADKGANIKYLGIFNN